MFIFFKVNEILNVKYIYYLQCNTNFPGNFLSTNECDINLLKLTRTLFHMFDIFLSDNLNIQKA